jgi:hypothetical protein
MRTVPSGRRRRYANRCPDCGATLWPWDVGQEVCPDCCCVALGPCTPARADDADDADRPLTWAEAVERAAEFGRRLGFAVDPRDVLAVDHAWLEQFGESVGGVYDRMLGDGGA